MSTAPAVMGVLRVDTQTSSSRSMNVYNMTPSQITGMKRGKRVRVFINDQGGPKFLMNVNLRALCAFMPAVSKALNDHNTAKSGTVYDVYLPPHSIATYKRVMAWMLDCIDNGKVAKFAKFYRSNTMQIYKDTKALADDLRIGYLSKDMDRRIRAMSH